LPILAHGHDLALGSLRAQFQLCRKRSPFHAKRMIPAGFEWLRQAVENAAVIMSHERCLAMHQSLGAYDVAPEITYEALVPQAHAEDRDPAGKCIDHLQRHSRILRTSGAR